jgi:hypothetical protein
MRRRKKKDQEKNVTRMQAQPASHLASRLHVGATDAGGWIYVEGKERTLRIHAELLADHAIEIGDVSRSTRLFGVGLPGVGSWSGCGRLDFYLQ